MSRKENTMQAEPTEADRARAYAEEWSRRFIARAAPSLVPIHELQERQGCEPEREKCTSM